MAGNADVRKLSMPDGRTLDVLVDGSPPFDQGKWLAAHVPNAQVRLYDDEGHLSLVAQFDRILVDLLELSA
jgi:hypothetical protein